MQGTIFFNPIKTYARLYVADLLYVWTANMFTVIS